MLSSMLQLQLSQRLAMALGGQLGVAIGLPFPAALSLAIALRPLRIRVPGDLEGVQLSLGLYMYSACHTELGARPCWSSPSVRQRGFHRLVLGLHSCSCELKWSEIEYGFVFSWTEFDREYAGLRIITLDYLTISILSLFFHTHDPD